MLSFPSLFALEDNKDCKLVDRWKCTNGNWEGGWDWRYSPRGRSVDKFTTLFSLLQDLQLIPGSRDCWKWNLDTKGCV